jgi:hypothetical protein
VFLLKAEMAPDPKMASLWLSHKPFYYKEIKSEFSITAKAKILFLSLAESIAQALNVTSCYVCGGHQHGRPLGLRKR